jgi:hypothetical protein
MDRDQPLLIFLHIPRAGGTSLWAMLREAHQDRVRRVRGKGLSGTFAEVRDLAARGAPGYDVIGGHVPFGVGRDCPKPVRYITVLRDPTDIVLSRHFKRLRPEVQRRKKARDKAAAPDPEMALTEVLRRQQANPMTKLLSNAQVDGLQPGLTVTRRHLEEAKENLQRHFAAVAFVEDYEASVRRMAERLGWAAVPQVAARNVGATQADGRGGLGPSGLATQLSQLFRRPPPSTNGEGARSARKGYPSEVYEVGREVHALDYELYAFAREQFGGATP